MKILNIKIDKDFDIIIIVDNDTFNAYKNENYPVTHNSLKLISQSDDILEIDKPLIFLESEKAL